MTNLPSAVADYINAVNAADRERFLAAFADDALVDDVKRQFRGKAAIAEWAERETFAVNVSMEVLRASEVRGDWVADVKLDGTFPKVGLPDPLIMTFTFTLKNDKIAKLLIVLKKPAA